MVVLTGLEIVQRTLVVTGWSACILVPIWLILQPSPRSYFNFIWTFFGVRMQRKPEGHRWLPHYFTVLFVAFLLSQGVTTILHYPLLVNNLGASVLQVGLIDAASFTISAALDMTLRAGPLRKMPRSGLFVMHAVCSVLAYVVIIGLIIPNVAKGTALALVILAQVVAGLDIPFQEFGVMRNDAKDDFYATVQEEIHSGADTDASMLAWKDAGKISAKLGQLHVVMRYPATLVASAFFAILFYLMPGDQRQDTFTAYIFIGVAGCILGLEQAYVWRGHTPNVGTAGKTSNVGADILPGGRYFTVLVEVGIFNAVSQAVRNGYPRMINLRALTMSDVHTSDIGRLMVVVFGISAAFFFLSDVGNASRASERWRSRRNIGLLSFTLLGVGHGLMGRAKGFKGLLASAIVFGFGQATSTGLRTVWKDEVRGLLRCDGHGEQYRKQLLRVLGAVGAMTNITNSLLMGVIGNTLGMSAASFIYAGMSVFGLIWTIRLNSSLRSRILSESQRLDADMDDLLAQEDMDDPITIGYWHPSFS